MVKRSMALCVLIGVAGWFAVSYGALNFDPTAYYRISNRWSGNTLDNNGSASNNTPIYPKTNDVSDTSGRQQWQIILTQSTNRKWGRYKILCTKFSKVLDGCNGRNKQVVQYSDLPSAYTQEWEIRDLNTGYFQIINLINNCAISSGTRTTSPVILSTSNPGLTKQQWRIEKIQWKQTKYTLATWEDPCLVRPIGTNPNSVSASDIASFQFCKNAYFNMLTNTGRINGLDFSTPTTLAEKRYGLHVASRVQSQLGIGLQYMVQDQVDDPDDWDETFGTRLYSDAACDAVADYYKKVEPAARNVFDGYFVGHEVSSDYFVLNPHGSAEPRMRNMKNWIRGLKLRDPTRQSFVCAPSYMLFRDNWNADSWFKYIDTVFNDSDPLKNPDYLCYDEYPFYDDGADGHCNSMYFRAFSSFRKIAGSRPWWKWNGICNEPGIAIPTEYTVRFQTFTAIAYGATGLGYFIYKTWTPPGANAQLGIVGSSGDNRDNFLVTFSPSSGRTRYSLAKELNCYITRVIAPIALNSYCLGAFHQSGQIPDLDTYVPPEEGLPVPGVHAPILRSLSDINAMAGVFRDKTTPSTFYLLIVNKNRTAISNMTVSLNQNLLNNITISPSSINFTSSSSTLFSSNGLNACYVISTDETIIDCPQLLPGEGRMLKIINVPFSPSGEVAAAQSANGIVWCFAKGTDNNLYYRKQSSAGNFDDWGAGWTYLNGPVSGNIAVGRNNDNALFIYTAGPAQQLQCISQNGPDGAWSSQFTEIGRAINGQVATAQFGSVPVLQAVFARSAVDSTLYYAIQRSAAEAPSEWKRVQGSGGIRIGEHIAAATNPGDGSIDVFVTNLGGQLLRYKINSSGTCTSLPKVIPNTDLSTTTVNGDIIVGRNLDNRLEVFYNNSFFPSSPTLLHSYQQTAGSNTWVNSHVLEGANLTGFPMAIGTNSDGRLEILYRNGNSGQIMHHWQQSPNGNWNVNLPLDYGVLFPSGPIALSNFTNGRLMVLCTGPSGNKTGIFYSYQDYYTCMWNSFVEF